jgi:hypothetical protein
VEDILNAFGNRAFGALMLVFAAPNALPLPPGASAILGAPLLFITAQLMIGRPVLWLPGFIARRSMARETFVGIVGKLVPLLRRSERYVGPRLTSLVAPAPERLIGAACLALALVLFLPIPLGNMLPGFTIAAFALAIVERDGVLALVGWLATAGSALLMAAVSTAVVAGAEALIGMARGFF